MEQVLSQVTENLCTKMSWHYNHRATVTEPYFWYTAAFFVHKLRYRQNMDKALIVLADLDIGLCFYMCISLHKFVANILSDMQE